MEEKDLQLHEEASLHLWSATKWMKFMAVMMLIGAAFLVLAAIMVLAMGSLLQESLEFPTWIMSILYFVMAGMYIFPSIYLLRACKSGKAAAEDNDNEALVAFLKSTKSFWKFLGIFTIAMIGFCLIIFPIVILVAAL